MVILEHPGPAKVLGFEPEFCVAGANYIAVGFSEGEVDEVKVVIWSSRFRFRPAVAMSRLILDINLPNRPALLDRRRRLLCANTFSPAPRSGLSYGPLGIGHRTGDYGR